VLQGILWRCSAWVWTARPSGTVQGVLQFWASLARERVRWIRQWKRYCCGIPKVPRQVVRRSSAQRRIYLRVVLEICALWWVKAKASCHITGVFHNNLSLVDTAILCEQCTCTNIDHLSTSLHLSVHVTHVKGITCVCWLTILRLVVVFLWLYVRSTQEICVCQQCRGMASGQGHELMLRGCNHKYQADTWQVYRSVNVWKVNQLVETE